MAAKVALYSAMIAVPLFVAVYSIGMLTEGVWSHILNRLYYPSGALAVLLAKNPHNPSYILGFVLGLVQTFFMVFFLALVVVALSRVFHR